MIAYRTEYVNVPYIPSIRYNPDMIREDIRTLIVAAVSELRAEQGWDLAEMPARSTDTGHVGGPVFDVSRVKDERFGDYATNIAMILAKPLGRSPMDVAGVLKEKLVSLCHSERVRESRNLPDKNEEIPRQARDENSLGLFEKIEVAKPGYINFHLSPLVLADVLRDVLAEGDRFGDSEIGKGKKVLLEFISANPTGPIHLGNARGGPLGDTLARVLEKSGYSVTNEYYVNDYGNQVRVLGHSILKDDEAQYRGGYIDDLAEELGVTDVPREALPVGMWAAGRILEQLIKPVCGKANIRFDNWFSEKSLHDSGEVAAVLDLLREKELTYEKEGAIWFRSMEFGDDKDRVLVKSDEEKTVTYTAPDFAYHKNKIDRGFDILINIQGADHHGQAAVVGRFVEDVLGAKDVVKLILTQFVKIMQDGVEVKMSKRRGTYYALDDLIEEVGKDAVRFIFSSYAATSHIVFDIDLALERSAKNPVYYVQYAHARLASVLRKAEEAGLSLAGHSEPRPPDSRQRVGQGVFESSLPAGEAGNLSDQDTEILRRAQDDNAKDGVDLSLLTHPKERELLRELSSFPELIEGVAETYAVHHLPQYAIRIADKLHSFYADCRVIDAEHPELTKARLALALGVKIVLRETLGLLGIDAPERMEQSTDN